MKISLTFNIYNKEHLIKEAFSSWLTNLSGKHEYEVIMNFDDLKDKSQVYAQETFDKYLLLNPNTKITLEFTHTPNLYELKCTNMLLKKSTGDIICVIQDDNYMYSKNWDDKLIEVFDSGDNVGCVGMLAGVTFNFSRSGMGETRYEILTDHKNPNVHNPVKHPTDKAYVTQTVIRPFAIKKDTIQLANYLDEIYSPFCWDDIDLCFRLLDLNKIHYYYPFDVVNLSANTTVKNIGYDTAESIFNRNRKMIWERNWKKYSRF